jgi:hypothetical protein
MALHRSRNVEINNIDMNFVVPVVNWPFVSLNETFPTTQLVTSIATNMTAVRSCKILSTKFDLGCVDSKHSKSYRLASKA